jgi:hypothetical protein
MAAVSGSGESGRSGHPVLIPAASTAGDVRRLNTGRWRARSPQVGGAERSLCRGQVAVACHVHAVASPSSRGFVYH